jgi:outer membrane lipopolysaccharide assembly protein LptE/RlpB
MNNTVKSFILLILISLLAACGMPTNSDNVDAQVQTAIAQTAQVEATFQVAVNQAVEATVIAMPPTPTPQPTIDPYTLTEEELAALIDASCEEAATVYKEAGTATTQAASDGAYTEEEIYDSIYYVYDAEAAIAYTEELLYLYYDLYGAYTSDALDLLYSVEDDLVELAYAMTEVEAILSQGAETASAAIEQVNAALEIAQTKANEMQTKAQEYKDNLPTVLEERENRFADLAPAEVASNREGAILQVYTYLDSVKAAFGDRKISPDEMGQIAQLAANAKAGINQSGGPLLQGFGGNIDDITRNISRGDWPSAQRDIGGFEASLPSRPARR